MSFLEYPNAVDFYCKNGLSMPSRAYVSVDGVIVLTDELVMVSTLPWNKIKKIKAKKSNCSITIKMLSGTKTRLMLERYTELGRFLLAVQGYVGVTKGFGWRFGKRVAYIKHSKEDQQPEQKPKASFPATDDRTTTPEIELVHGSFEQLDDPRFPTMFFDNPQVPPPPPPSPENPDDEEAPKTELPMRRSDRLTRSALFLKEDDILAAMELRPATPPKAAPPAPEKKAPARWMAPEPLMVPPFEAGELMWGFSQDKPSFLYPPYPCKHAWYECDCSLSKSD